MDRFICNLHKLFFSSITAGELFYYWPLCVCYAVEISEDDVDNIIVLECDTDQVVSSLTNVHSQYRSKVGSISAAEAVKSLQQPVLVKAEPVPPSTGIIWLKVFFGNYRRELFFLKPNKPKDGQILVRAW